MVIIIQGGYPYNYETRPKPIITIQGGYPSNSNNEIKPKPKITIRGAPLPNPNHEDNVRPKVTIKGGYPPNPSHEDNARPKITLKGASPLKNKCILRGGHLFTYEDETSPQPNPSTHQINSASTYPTSYQSNPSTHQINDASTSPTSYQPNSSTCHINPLSTYHNPYLYQSISQQSLSYATSPSSSHQHIYQHQQQIISQQEVQTPSQPQQIPQQHYMSSSSTSYQPNSSTYHVNVTSTNQPSPQHYPISHSNIPAYHQAHPRGNQQQEHVSPNPMWQQTQMPSTSYQPQNLLSTYPTITPSYQDYQWPPQQAPVSLSPPLQQETRTSPSGPLYINHASLIQKDLITFDKGDTNLANASYEWPSPSNPMPTHEPTSPIIRPPCDPTPSPSSSPSCPSSTPYPCSPNPLA